MPLDSIVAGATSQSINVIIRDSSSTTGAGLGGIAPAGGSLLSGFKCYYSFTGANATAVSVSLSVLAAVNSAYSSGGIVEIDATNMKGTYRVDLPNAAIAASKGRQVSIYFYGGTNVAPAKYDVELTGWDNQDGVRGGMTALPNAAAAAAGGLIVLGSNNTAAITIGALTTGAISLTTLTASGAVAFQSTFAVTTSTALGAVSGTTLTLSGAVAFQSTLAVTGTTTLTGAVSLGSTLGVTGTTTLAAVTTTGTVTLNALTVSNATTLTGAVSLGSTLGVTGTTTFAAINTGTLTTTGNWAVSGTVTLTGAVTASNAGNNIVGVATTATNANAIADAILNRDWTLVTDSNARTLLNAARAIRNKWSIAAGTLTVTKEDDATSAWTSALLGTAGADPITTSDPT